jgi:hypothetical protein
MLYYSCEQKTNEGRGGNRSGAAGADMYLYPLQAPVAATGSGTKTVSLLPVQVLVAGSRVEYPVGLSGDGSGR